MIFESRKLSLSLFLPLDALNLSFDRWVCYECVCVSFVNQKVFDLILEIALKTMKREKIVWNSISMGGRR